MTQSQLFKAEAPAPLVDKRPARICAGCEFIREPTDVRYIALGLWQCKWDGPASFRSTRCADGELRRCDHGYR
jgi:hypothetical protein